MKTSCQDIQKLITPHLAGDLSPVGETRFRKHLENCPDCQAALAELQPAFEEIRQALSATPAGEPPRLASVRHRRILNAARSAAARRLTFADRLARWFDYGFPPATRTIFLRTALPIALTVLVVLGFGAMLLPSLSMSRKSMRAENVEMVSMMAPQESVQLEKLEYLKQDFAKIEDLPQVVDGLAQFDLAEPLAQPDAPDQTNFKQEKRGAEKASDEVTDKLSANVPLLTKSPLIIKNLYGNRMSASRSDRASGSGSVSAGAKDSDADPFADDYTVELIPPPASATAGPAPAAPAAPAPQAKKPVGATGGTLGLLDEGVARSPREMDARTRSNAPVEAEKPRLVGDDLSDMRKDLKAKATQAGEQRERKELSKFQAWGVNPYIETARQPFSTFAIDVDTASYTFTRNNLLQGKLPPPESVRTEEIVNFFDYHYSPPPAESMFAIHAQCAPAPFRPGQQLLRIGVKARRLGREENRPAMLTFAIDTSGSMSSPDRLGLVQKALRLLVDKLSPDDKVAVIQFDTHARLVLDYTRASDKARILNAINALQTSGSTNLEEGMRLAYESARRAFQPGSGNRVLLLSDGAANLGGSTADEILAIVADSRRQGIFCSVYGVGRGGLNDAMLESLANKGDGSYVYLDSLDEARRVFVDELAASLNTVAADVKIQVEFTPSRVEQYRQLGYENRQLKKEDFRNDAVDAGEVGSGQSVTALYELGLAPGSRGPLGIVRIRYRDLRTGRTEEIASPLTETMLATSFARTDASFQLAACAAEWAEILRGSPYAAGDDPAELVGHLRRVALQYALDARVQELLRLTEITAQLKRGSQD